MEEQRQPERRMIISPRWLHVSIITFIFGFTVLGLLAVSIYRDHPPIPENVITQDGRVLFTGDDVMTGQHNFQRFGLMQFGTIFGHGAYLGPDFTAQALHQATTAATEYYTAQGLSPAEARDRVITDFKDNRFDRETGTLTFTPAQAFAFERLNDYYRDWFDPSIRHQGLSRPKLNEDDLRTITSYFTWAAWTSSVVRPGKDYSYTNNWPPEPLAGNEPTAHVFLWSVISLIGLLGGTGLVLFIFGRYNLLGWRRVEEEMPDREIRFRPPEDVRLSPSQRATAWYFLVVAGLFLAQGLLGGVNAHYHVEPEGFYGTDIANLLPYNLSRTWHLQLALFFVATSFLAMGIFLVPMIARREPKHQEKLSIALFGAVVVVVIGSLLGQAASYSNRIGLDGPWFWLGSQGWEFLDLGRMWQILLTIGMAIWVLILFRGLRSRLAGEHPGNLPYLFLFSAISIPLFYAAGLLFGKMSNFTVMDFWRFWVVHLWVEDFLELFTTITVAFVFVLLGVVGQKTATRVVYLDIILYSVGGVIGTMHHVYFNGAPAQHMALGAVFSALEVIPLVLLTVEAWRFIQLGNRKESECAFCTPAGVFPHKWAVMFLIAVGFWNFLGAGVFGFLINLPIVSYYEIGTQFTANHAHGAMMGVYGMLAIGFFIFVARYFIRPDRRSEQAMKISFWSLNIGLAYMIFVNLIPIGALQLFESFQNGYWFAREPQFFAQPIVRVFEWLRMPGDVLFIVGGIFPIVYLAIRMFLNRNRYVRETVGPETETFVQVYEETGNR